MRPQRGPPCTVPSEIVTQVGPPKTDKPRQKLLPFQTTSAAVTVGNPHSKSKSKSKSYCTGDTSGACALLHRRGVEWDGTVHTCCDHRCFIIPSWRKCGTKNNTIRPVEEPRKKQQLNNACALIVLSRSGEVMGPAPVHRRTTQHSGRGGVSRRAVSVLVHRRGRRDVNCYFLIRNSNEPKRKMGVRCAGCSVLGAWGTPWPALY